MSTKASHSTEISSVSVFGIIQPKNSNSTGCGMEGESRLPKLRRRPEPLQENVLVDLRDHYTEHNSPANAEFWKNRIIVHTLCAPQRIVRSVTFMPKNLSIPSILFVQKGDENLHGFVAPYLSDEQKVEWGALSSFSELHRINDRESLLETIKGLDGVVYEHLLIILQYFLEDATSQGLGVTYMSRTGDYVTCGWYKA